MSRTLAYETPRLVRFGKIADLTTGGKQVNQDVPFGNAPNTACPLSCTDS